MWLWKVLIRVSTGVQHVQVGADSRGAQDRGPPHAAILIHQVSGAGGCQRHTRIQYPFVVYTRTPSCLSSQPYVPHTEEFTEDARVHNRAMAHVYLVDTHGIVRWT